MFSRKKKQSNVAADQFNSSAHDAVDSAASFLDDAIDRITPLVGAAAGRATDLASQFGPLADQARETASQNLSQAGDRIGPLASQVASQARDAAKDRLAPATGAALLASGVAKGKGAELAGQALEALAPRVQTLKDAAQPHVDTAKARVQADLVPQLTELLQQVANDHPAVADYSNRGQVALQALRGETTKYVPVEVDDPNSSKLKSVAKVAACGAVLAAAAVAIRQFLGSKDDGWTAHKPSTGYTPTPTTPAASTTSAAPSTSTPSAPASSGNDTEAAAPLVATTPAEAEEVMVDEGGPVEEPAASDAESTTSDATTTDTATTDTAVTDGAATTEPQYGEGWYIGENPPADYTIKGNERSMKYHVPGSGGYDRTIADVWFSDEEAAQKAGFTRAQR